MWESGFFCVSLSVAVSCLSVCDHWMALPVRLQLSISVPLPTSPTSPIPHTTLIVIPLADISQVLLSLPSPFPPSLRPIVICHSP
jgi:hypothetical protein